MKRQAGGETKRQKDKNMFSQSEKEIGRLTQRQAGERQKDRKIKTYFDRQRKRGKQAD